MANRHDVIIWDAEVYGAPKNFVEGLEMAFVLSEQAISSPVSQKLLAFAADVEKYIQTNPVPPKILRHLKYLEAEIKGMDTAAFCVELPRDYWHSIVKILLTIALEHHLVLVDEEIALVLLPDGSISPERSAKYWLPILEGEDYQQGFPQTHTELHQLLIARANKLLGVNGFRINRNTINEDGEELDISYIRQTAFGDQEISFSCLGGGDGEFRMYFYLCLVPPESYIKPIMIVSEIKYPEGGIILDLPIILIKKDVVILNSWESFEQLFLMLKEFVLTWANAAQDLKGMDALLNGNVDEKIRHYVHHDTYMPYALIIARLAKNPNFEQLAISLAPEKNKNFWQANPVPFTIAWPKLVQYLREEINPDTFEYQYALLKEEEKRLEENRIQELITQFQLNLEQEVIPVSDQWYDSKLNLIWQRCFMGEQWQDGQLTGKAELLNWDEMNAYLAQFRNTGWRLPTRRELLELTFTKKIGYVTKQGFDFYVQNEQDFLKHWVQPYNINSLDIKKDEIHVLRREDGKIMGMMLDRHPNMKAYVRLVKSVS